MCHHLPVLQTQLFPHLTGVRLQALRVLPQQITIVVTSAASSACCPVCHHWSWRVHSRFIRRFADLPISSRATVLEFWGRRFFCVSNRCPRRTFREQVREIGPAYQRHTTALHQAVERLGFALGGRPAVRLAYAQGFPNLECTRIRRRDVPADRAHVTGPSRMAFLRAVRSATLPTPPAPRQMGVDDWAWSKGKTSGTLIVDLETHRPVDLLSDRTADTFAAWLHERPGIEMISRDRWGAYTEGAQQGAPQALQVADRFHVVKNFVEALERFLLRKGPVSAFSRQMQSH